MTMPTTTMQRAHDEAMGGDDPTLPPKPRRRNFSAEYKLAMVEDYDACVGDGDKGALLRQEGLYSSHIVEWRRGRDAAALDGLSPRVRQSRVSPEAADLAKHRLALDIAVKAHALLEKLAESAAPESKPKP
jgi:transposase-like protein